jgi:hypothetical protein
VLTKTSSATKAIEGSEACDFSESSSSGQSASLANGACFPADYYLNLRIEFEIAYKGDKALNGLSAGEFSLSNLYIY